MMFDSNSNNNNNNLLFVWRKLAREYDQMRLNYLGRPKYALD